MHLAWIQYIFDFIFAVFLFLVYIYLQQLPNQPSHIGKPMYGVLAIVLSIIVFIVVMWLVKKRNQKSSLEIKQPVTFKKGVLFTIGMIILLPIIQFIFTTLNGYLFTPTNGGTQNNQAIEEMLKNPSIFVFTVISSVLLAPLLEELIFRRVLINQIPRKATVLFVIRVVVSILLFGLLHVMGELGNGVAMILPILTYLTIGTILTVIYIRTGSLFYSIMGHIINNSLAVLALIL